MPEERAIDLFGLDASSRKGHAGRIH
jgi:hypothetical protein